VPQMPPVQGGFGSCGWFVDGVSSGKRCSITAAFRAGFDAAVSASSTDGQFRNRGREKRSFSECRQRASPDSELLCGSRAMKAIVIYAPNDLRYEQVTDQPLGRDDVRVKIEVGGICGSDLHYYHHGGFGTVKIRHPMILGHEIAGVVAETGQDVTSLRIGQRITVNPSLSCGICVFCRKGLRNQCLDMRFYGSAMRTPHVDGGFREALVCKAEQAIPIPDTMTLGEAAFTEPVAVCLHAASRPGSLLSKRVLVLGAGPIGTILALIARSAGAGFVVVGDVIDEPLRRLADLGVDEAINVATEADRLARHAEGKGTFDIVFEASGSAGATISAIDVVKPRGTIVCVGQGARPELNMSAVVTKEINLIGSFRFDDEFRLAVDYIARNRAQIRALLTATVPASEPTPAFDLAADKTRSIKVHLQF
jgi:L-idonate 5-dehydrogenase